MDNDELRKVLHAYTGDFVPVLRAELARLIVDSDELAALKARIAGAAVVEVIEHEVVDVDARRIETWGSIPFVDADMIGQRVALLRLPVGEG